jgi:hypothetical protein
MVSLLQVLYHACGPLDARDEDPDLVMGVSA